MNEDPNNAFKFEGRYSGGIFNTESADEHTVRFGIGDSTSLGTAVIPTCCGDITVHVMPTDTPLLWSGGKCFIEESAAILHSFL